MFKVKCRKNLGNAVVQVEIQCKNEQELVKTIEWTMEENIKTAPILSYCIDSIEIIPEPWVCQYCGQVIENDKNKRYTEYGEHICRECLKEEKKFHALFEGEEDN